MKSPKKPTDFFLKNRYYLVFTLAFITYINTIPNDFNLDDELVVTTNKDQPNRLTSKGLGAIAEIFSEPYYKDDQGYSYDYRPVVLTTFAIEGSVFGANPNNPHISHFINIVLYAFVCTLLLFTLSTLFSSYSWLLAFTSTLLFAAHPIHTEVVASIKNRDEILALGFGLLSLCSFVYIEKASQKWLYFILSVLAFIAGLLSKQTIISFALIIPISAILFTGIRGPLILLFASIAPLTYVPLSNLISIFYAAVFVCIFPLSAGLLLLVKRTDPNIFHQKVKQWGSWWKLSLSKLSRFYNVENKEMLQLDLISATQFYVISILLIICSLGLKAVDAPMAALPLFTVYIFPFLLPSKSQKNSFLFLFCVTLCLYIFLPFSDNLFFFTSAYFNFVLVSVNIKEYRFISLLIVIIRAIKDPIAGRELIVTIVTWINLSDRYNKLTKLISLAIGAFGLFSVINLLSDRNWSPAFLGQHLLVALLILWPYSIRRYVFIPICFFLILSNTTFPTLPSRIDTKPYIDLLYTKPTKVIEQSEIDRPINFVESVTNYLSPFHQKMGTAAQVIRKCFIALALPWNQSFYYGYKVIDLQSVFTFANLLTLSFYILLAGSAVVLARKLPVVSYGLWIIVIGAIVFSGLLVSIPGMMADRFLFVPSIGFSILVSYSLVFIFGPTSIVLHAAFRWRDVPKKLTYGLYAILTFYLVLTMYRNSQWKNHITLFSSDISDLQESAQANNLYALQLMIYSFKEFDPLKRKEMIEKAEQHFEQAIRVYPNFANAQFDLARVQSILGKQQYAMSSFYKAALLNPTYPQAWLSAGECAMNNNDLDKAKLYFNQGLLRNPNYPEFYIRSSLVYYLLKEFDSSNIVSKKAMSLFPQNPDFATNIGQTFISKGDKDSALYYLNLALSISPGNSRAVNMMQSIKKQSF